MDLELNFARDAYMAALLKCTSVRAYELIREAQRTRKIFKDVYMAPFKTRIDNAIADHHATNDALKDSSNNDPVTTKHAYSAAFYELREAEEEFNQASKRFDEIYE